MKNILKMGKNTLWLLPILMVSFFTSCKKDNAGGSKDAPTIQRIRVISKLDTIKNVVHRVNLDVNQVYDDYRVKPFDSTVVTGQLNNLYAIVGTSLKTTLSVSFNGYKVYFNPTLVTDNSIIVNTGTLTPYGPGQTDEIIVTTQYGTAKFKFPIKQPASTITDFSPLAGGAGDIVTINGLTFENLIAVRFGTIPAEIVGTPTKTQIKVKVPAGVVQANIFVETAGGITKSVGSFGFKYLAFDDALPTGWSLQGYNGVTFSTSTENPKRGTMSIKNTFPGAAYGGFKYYYNGATVSTSTLGLTSVKLSIFGGPGSTGKQVSLGLSGNYNNRITLTLTAGVYTDFTVPLSQLGNPTSITELVLQDFSGGGYIIYIDDIGFI
ncbi:hypothetical protein EZJ43_03965 [Pedobacter changchengzhani]|uniref:Uncharacterized protein n=1 Tax=Pedobacter changchengzhani TaxID=2529274 RepID=A0A4R5MNE6_9SPHI|nr:IPT/TIG domain-containing protein [Pedobacter changchengzhani]TDG37282.1 hypothetical protein EZJ43_03965 [Pedobacter changchengzhani]